MINLEKVVVDVILYCAKNNLALRGSSGVPRFVSAADRFFPSVADRILCPSPTAPFVRRRPCLSDCRRPYLSSVATRRPSALYVSPDRTFRPSPFADLVRPSVRHRPDIVSAADCVLYPLLTLSSVQRRLYFRPLLTECVITPHCWRPNSNHDYQIHRQVDILFTPIHICEYNGCEPV